MSAAMVEFLYSLDFIQISLIISDDVYGRDVAANILENAKSLSLTVVNTHFFQPGNITQIYDTLDEAYASGVKNFVYTGTFVNDTATIIRS